MSTSKERRFDREALAERALRGGGVTVALVVLATGAASLATEAAPGFGERLPVYVIGGAVAFLGALLLTTYATRDGKAILRRAAMVGVAGCAVLALGTEGLIYGFLVLASDLTLYLLAAGVVACGLLYWSLHNWGRVDDLTTPW